MADESLNKREWSGTSGRIAVPVEIKETRGKSDGNNQGRHGQRAVASLAHAEALGECSEAAENKL